MHAVIFYRHHHDIGNDVERDEHADEKNGNSRSPFLVDVVVLTDGTSCKRGTMSDFQEVDHTVIDGGDDGDDDEIARDVVVHFDHVEIGYAEPKDESDTWSRHPRGDHDVLYEFVVDGRQVTRFQRHA